MTWRIEFLRSAQKSAKSLNPKARSRIRQFLTERVATLDDPRAIGRPLHGSLGTYWRYRIGDYRVICDIQDQKLVILVINLGHRRDVYR